MLSNSIKIFTLFGFEIKLDPSWFFIAALIVWSLSVDFFPSVLENPGDQSYVIISIIGMLGFFGSLILHELAHSLMARRVGVHIKGITLFIFGGIAELDSEPETASSEFWIAIVGPAMSLALSVGFIALSRIAAMTLNSEAIVALLAYLATVNLVLAVFNLLPAFPLDGGRVYRAFLWNRSGDFLQATRRASNMGVGLAYVLIGMGILGLFGGLQIGGLWQVFIGIFLLITAKGTYQRTLFSAALKDKTVGSMMSRNPFTVSPDQTLSELVNLIMLRHHTVFVPVVEDGVLLGYVDSDVVGTIDRGNWSSTFVGDVFVARDNTNSITPETPASAVLDRMLEAKRRKFLVVEDGHLLGVITLSDMMGYLSVLQEVGAPFTPARQG